MYWKCSDFGIFSNKFMSKINHVSPFLITLMLVKIEYLKIWKTLIDWFFCVKSVQYPVGWIKKNQTLVSLRDGLF